MREDLSLGSNVHCPSAAHHHGYRPLDGEFCFALEHEYLETPEPAVAFVCYGDLGVEPLCQSCLDLRGQLGALAA